MGNHVTGPPVAGVGWAVLQDGVGGAETEITGGVVTMAGWVGDGAVEGRGGEEERGRGLAEPAVALAGEEAGVQDGLLGGVEHEVVAEGHGVEWVWTPRDFTHWDV